MHQEASQKGPLTLMDARSSFATRYAFCQYRHGAYRGPRRLAGAWPLGFALPGAELERRAISAAAWR